MDRDWLPVEKTWKLNERHYGALQGLNKADTAAKYGDDQVKVWRRSFDVRPPALEPGDERDAHTQPAYRDVPADQIPYAECLEDTIARVWPWFQEVVEPQMRAGKRIVIAAHGNSLRALVKQFDGLTPDEILEVNIPRPSRWSTPSTGTSTWWTSSTWATPRSSPPRSTPWPTRARPRGS